MIEPIYGTYNGSEIVIPAETISWDSERKCVKMIPQIVEKNGIVPAEIYLNDEGLSFPEEKKEEIEKKISELLGADFYCLGDCWQLRF